MSFEVRNFKEKDFVLFNSWQIQLNWNPGIYDVLPLKNNPNQNGLKMGVLDGQPIAAFGATMYNQYAFIGVYIVKQQFRKKGYGYQLWKQSFPFLNANNVGLDAVLEEVSLYQKTGFKQFHKTIRFEFQGTNIHYCSQNLKECQSIQKQQIFDYDRKCFPSQRKAIISYWIDKMPQSKSIAYVQNNQVKGYGILRKTFVGYRIYPLYADNLNIANQILKFLRGFVSQKTSIFMDMPDSNQNTADFVTQHRFRHLSTYARMYTKEVPKNVDYNKIYGACSLLYG